MQTIPFTLVNEHNFLRLEAVDICPKKLQKKKYHNNNNNKILRIRCISRSKNCTEYEFTEARSEDLAFNI
ncbi:hypothetical protein QVD17_11744 [Tagetes erecta]|uniref:Uncharacterized protein n=1 Tax=Tagetes erecta TaxID=13708 RepID=A0AAD8KXV8_TARER|nr:hypothetical protein QVD17_11744 [Tagetes erecta]